jgi:hypothetical protein
MEMTLPDWKRKVNNKVADLETYFWTAKIPGGEPGHSDSNL